jgi:hypothetical protein
MTLTTATDAERPARSYDRVLELSGIIAAAAADTIALRLGELRTAAGPVAGTAREVVLVPTAAIASIAERRFQMGQTVGLGLGVVTLAVSVFLVVIIVTLTKAAGA